MRRRELVLGVIGAVAAHSAAPAQQPARPVVGYLSSGAPAGREKELEALRHGLAETGYVEGNNLALEFCWAGDDYDRLKPLAAELVRRRVAVIVAPQLASALAAKSATAAIPIVFLVGDDPVRHGLAQSLARPGGNATGVSMLAVGLVAKRLQLMGELVAEHDLMAVLVNRTNANVATELAEVHAASRAVGQRVAVFDASTPAGIEAAFAAIAAAGAKALVVGPDPFFNSRRREIVALAARRMLPAIYEWREFVEAGGLASYGTDLADALHRLGRYTGRILKGEKPADLPVVQPTRFELVINLKTARALGLTVPQSILARADEVIE